MINSFSLYINKFLYYLFKTILNESKFMKMRKKKKKARRQTQFITINTSKKSFNFINYFVDLRYQFLARTVFSL